ncbi:MAG: AAA family ATPase [Chloroflexota bacterium]
MPSAKMIYVNARACPSCGQENATGSKFCNDCGGRLPTACAGCGAENPPGSKFCSECGTQLLTAVNAGTAPATKASDHPPATTTVAAPEPPAPSAVGQGAERRLVTALFCDLVGSTPIADRLDPEEVRDVLAAYFSAMNAQIERFGGTVEKYAGDGILALFGAVQTHEDDAERAVLCGLGMQAVIEPVAEKARRQWGVDPQIRVGVNTGEVVRGTWTAPGWQDMAVTGDAVNVAARIQAAGESGDVLVGEETMRLTRRRIRFGPRRDLELKGKAGTVPIYPALSLREQFGERWETGDSAAPLVGRDREMVRLLDSWVRAQSGEGQLVTVVGDAGVGKSRLISEFLERVGTSGTVRVIRARCLSYGQEISLWLVADLLRSLFGIAEQDDPVEVRAKLVASVGASLAGQTDTTRAEAVDVLGEALGLAPGGSMVANAGSQIRRQALIRSIRLVLAATCERAPVILILEDMHWADEASQEVLREVLADTPGLRLLVLAAQRPGWTAAWSDWGWTERVTLRPLRDEESSQLATAVLGRPISPELDRYVNERSGGNPFFLEEMLRALQDAGDLLERDGEAALAEGAAQRLPSTLTEVLLARLDRLQTEVRTVAQIASVIGRTFGVRLLSEVTGNEGTALEPALAALQQAEIAFPRRGSQLEYVFKHVSMREVAYNTLLNKRRQELHLQTARAIAALYPSDEYAEMIAYHYARSEDHAAAAEWLERAGDQAAAVYANETAIGHYREARRRRELIGSEAIELAGLDEKLGSTLRITGRYDEATQVLEAAIEVYRQARDLEAAGRTMAVLAIVIGRQGRGRESQVSVEAMIDTLNERGPSKALAELQLSLSMVTQTFGDYEAELVSAERAAAIAQVIGDELVFAKALERRGTALSFLGRAEEAERALQDAIPRLEAVGELERLIVALGNVGESLRMGSKLAQSKQYFQRAVDTGERVGDRGTVAFMTMNLAEVAIALGEWDQSLELVAQADGILALLERDYTSAYVPAMRGRTLLYRGDWENGRRSLDEALSLALEFEDRQAIELSQITLAEMDIGESRCEAAIERLQSLEGDSQSGCHVPIAATLAWAKLELGEPADALALAEDGVETARSQGALLDLADALRINGMILVCLDRIDDARAAFSEGLDLAVSSGYLYAEGRTREQIGLLETESNPDNSAAALQEALALYRRLGASKDIERLENRRPPAA